MNEIDQIWTAWWTANAHRFVGTREDRFAFPIIAKEFAAYYHDVLMARI